MKFKKILITGSAGLLGRHVVRELMPHSHVIGFDLKKSDESIEQIVGSTTDFSAVLASCKDVDAVIHVAARPNIWSGTGEQILKDNVTSMRQLGIKYGVSHKLIMNIKRGLTWKHLYDKMS